MNNKLACFGLQEFALIMGLNCSAYPHESKLNKVLKREFSFQGDKEQEHHW